MDSNPQSPEVESQPARQFALLGDEKFQAGQYSQAIEDYEQAVLFGLDDPAVVARLGQCYLRLQRYDDAIGFLESQIRRYPSEAALHAHLSSAYLGAGKYSQGLQTLELACDLAPNDDELGLLLVRFYFEWGRHIKAIPLLERIVKNRPKDTESRARLAIAYLIANRVKDADLIVKALQREKPNEVELAFLMGMVNLRKGNSRQALKDFQRVIKQAPDYALAHYFIGEIYFEQRLWREASLAYLFSARASAHDAEPHAKLCLCYIEMNRPADAVAALQRALQIDPTHELALEIARQISV